MITFRHRLYLEVRFYAIAVLLITMITTDCTALQFPRIPTNVRLCPNNNILQSETASHHSVSLPNKEAVCDRRSIVAKALLPVATSFLLVQLPLLLPAQAAIDVSGLRQADTRTENSIIKNQIRSYDGSELTRVQEIQKMKATTSPMATTSSGSVAATTTNINQGSDDEKVGIASYAYRYSTAFQPRMTKVGNYGEKLRFDDQIMSSSSNQSNNNSHKGILSVSFEFPSDWLQLDKMLGGIQFVDQRNGDKLYVLKVILPPDGNLLTAPKQFFGDAIFHPQGAILRSGISVDEYKVKTSTILSDGSVSIPHRRLLLKYATVTPNGLRTERRAIVDAYEMDNVAYMMLTSSNAVKFDANGRERETVEAIADSFRIEKIV